ncbi:hypothetical protein BCL93_11355 [Onishia taeanensis]|uniref:Uncharacterized protein n=1 Tax=Onishia taeanensis TaxID=284577 RepID=A0A328XG11_9GAMM|nr:hypothetical protein BCL93_11355 [Halomonas taeanensis]
MNEIDTEGVKLSLVGAYGGRHNERITRSADHHRVPTAPGMTEAMNKMTGSVAVQATDEG